VANIFSYSVGGLFSLETISFIVQKLFNFMKSHLSILSLSCWDAGVLLRKSLPIPISSRLFSYETFHPDLNSLAYCHFNKIPEILNLKDKKFYFRFTVLEIPVHAVFHSSVDGHFDCFHISPQ
jgi:hypothetical protein